MGIQLEWDGRCFARWSHPVPSHWRHARLLYATHLRYHQSSDPFADFLAGPTPLDVASQYAHTVGLPQAMPDWAFGFHLCRWGYSSIQETRSIVHKMREAGIPLEVQWNDIDCKALDSRSKALLSGRDETVSPVPVRPELRPGRVQGVCQ